MAKGKGKGKGKRKGRTAKQRAATAKMIAANRARRRSNPAGGARAAGRGAKSRAKSATVRTVIVNPANPGNPSHHGGHHGKRRRRRRNPAGGMLFHAFSFLAAGAGGYLLDALADAVIPTKFAGEHPDAIRYSKLGAGVLGGAALGYFGHMPAAGVGLALGMGAMPAYDTYKAMAAKSGTTPAALPAGQGQALQGLQGLAVAALPAAPYPAYAEINQVPAWDASEAPTV